MEQMRAVLEQSVRRIRPAGAAGADRLPAALAWQLAAGEVLAQQARFAGLRDGVLRLEMPDAGVRRRVQSVAPELCRALSRLLREPVNRLEPVRSPRPSPSGPRGQAARGPAPMNE